MDKDTVTIDDYGAFLDEHKGWDERLVFYKYDNLIYAFRPIQGTTYDDVVEHMDDFVLAFDVATKVVVENMEEGGEPISLDEFFSIIVETIADNCTNAQGNPIMLEPVGSGGCVVDYEVSDEDDAESAE